MPKNPPDFDDPAPRKSGTSGPSSGRLVASVVDPSVLDDGLSLTGPGAPGTRLSVEAGDHPVKARLLSRARGKKEEEAPPSADFSGNARFQDPVMETFPAPVPPPAPATRTIEPELGLEEEMPPKEDQPAEPVPATKKVYEELERIAGHTSRPPTRSARLSPNLTALLGGLIGLTVMSSLGLYFGRYRPQTPEPSEEATTAPSASPSPAVTEPQKTVREKVKGPWRIADDAANPAFSRVEGQIKKLPFLKALEEAGLPKNEAYRVFGVLKEVKNLDRCGPNDKFVALTERASKKVRAFEYVVSPEEVYQVKAPQEGGPLKAAKLDLQVARNQVRRGLAYDGVSFEKSAEKAGFDQGLRGAVEKALAGHIPVSALKAGDRLRLIVQEVTVLGEFARYAGIEAIELLRQGKPAERYYYFAHPSQGGYFDLNGRAPYEGGYRKPIPGAPVTSKFNPKRLHPILKKLMPHTGTDFGCSTGVPIGATAPGVITFIGNGGPSGNLVKVKHDATYESGYAHLSRFPDGLHVGDSVDRLQLVGYCGSTGRSTGPHLHFTMKKNGQYIDSESMNLDGMRILPASERGPFGEIRAKYDPILDAILLPEVPVAEPAAEPAVTAKSGDPGQDPSEDDENAKPPSATPMAAPAPSAQPATPPGGRPVPGKPGASSIFLSNEDLLKMQGASDDGEVSE